MTRKPYVIVNRIEYDILNMLQTAAENEISDIKISFGRWKMAKSLSSILMITPIPAVWFHAIVCGICI